MPIGIDDDRASLVSSPGRRRVLAGIAAAAAGGWLGAARAQGAASGETAHRIDVHHHMAPPAYVAEIGRTMPVRGPLQGWTPAASVEDMDRAEVASAMLSITTPGLWFGDDAKARTLARLCNEYGARLAADHPGRFGLFAALPLPDIDGSLREIDYALDVLKADGVGLYTSYGDKWLGHPAFAPVFEELNRRKAVVYTHPVVNQCCVNLVPEVNQAVIEYGTDTTRTIASFVFSGAAARYGDIRMIFSHAGGTMPFLIERFDLLAKEPKLAARLPNGLRHELKKLYYDTAQSANPGAMSSLTALVSASQILLGSDFPYRTLKEHVDGLRGCGFSADELRAIERDNALTLLPHLRA
jgi:predicted TIM-barrel fold metal-dependent hydrolase